ncbi:MAG: hypothetical protein JNJ49_13190, partial [Bdellovibrionaceae bacterium]|nr:hypothetical protein [Pseudobdellovibrionaceae bacterium]
MKSLFLAFGVLFSASLSHASSTKASALEVLNAIVAPVQSEIAAGVADISSAVELQKYMSFISSGNTIDKADKVVKSGVTHYTLRIRDCHDNGRSCSRSGALYVVSISNVDGKK